MKQRQRQEVYPITFVATKLKLESLHPGDILEVVFKNGEAS